MSNKLFVVGAGPGNQSYMTEAAKDVLRASDCVVAAERHLPLVSWHSNVILLKNFEETMKKAERELEKGSVSFLVSGDPGIYSLLPLLKVKFPSRRIDVLPGISSLQCLCASASETWNGSAILSGHGKEIRESVILETADSNRSTVFFCGNDKNPSWLCSLLAEKLPHVKVTVGENLSYENERITCGSPADLKDKNFDSLSIALIINENPYVREEGRPRDCDFIRTDVPMTREEVRSVIIDKLRLKKDSVIWDIGSGTGSISIAAALECPMGEVHSVECLHEASELEKLNIDKFHIFNIKVHEGMAAEVIKNLPLPSHVFIGGSGRELCNILSHISSLQGGIRIVVSGVTLRTIANASELLSGGDYSDFDCIQLNVSRAKKIGSSTIMAAQNPIMIMSAVTKDKGDKR